MISKSMQSEDFEKNVWISIKGTQKTEMTDDIELITEGTLKKNDGLYELVYKESEMTGMVGTKTKMTISKDVVTVVREGKVQSNFIFTQGQRQVSEYKTTQGIIPMEIYTNKVDIDFSDKGGEIRVEYQIDFMNNIGKNYIHLVVKEA